jgi:hypothetical protein
MSHRVTPRHGVDVDLHAFGGFDDRVRHGDARSSCSGAACIDERNAPPAMRIHASPTGRRKDGSP